MAVPPAGRPPAPATLAEPIVIPEQVLALLRLGPDEVPDPKRLQHIRAAASYLKPCEFGDWVEVVQIADLDLKIFEYPLHAEQLLKLSREPAMRGFVGKPDHQMIEKTLLRAPKAAVITYALESRLDVPAATFAQVTEATLAKLSEQGLDASTIDTLALREALPEYGLVQDLIASAANRRQTLVGDYRCRQAQAPSIQPDNISDAEFE